MHFSPTCVYSLYSPCSSKSLGPALQEEASEEQDSDSREKSDLSR